uniref:translation initiation factor IF-2-like n=1 Tax=Nyctereutes procyonoides TaxID=34880 RepID=UPI00244401F2|nr:translation initiation factor IF-2-like [Nyctereutes procyonoides]
MMDEAAEPLARRVCSDCNARRRRAAPGEGLGRPGGGGPSSSEASQLRGVNGQETVYREPLPGSRLQPRARSGDAAQWVSLAVGAFPGGRHPCLCPPHPGGTARARGRQVDAASHRETAPGPPQSATSRPGREGAATSGARQARPGPWPCACLADIPWGVSREALWGSGPGAAPSNRPWVRGCQTGEGPARGAGQECEAPTQQACCRPSEAPASSPGPWGLPLGSGRTPRAAPSQGRGHLVCVRQGAGGPGQPGGALLSWP